MKIKIFKNLFSKQLCDLTFQCYVYIDLESDSLKIHSTKIVSVKNRNFIFIQGQIIKMNLLILVDWGKLESLFFYKTRHLSYVSLLIFIGSASFMISFYN